MRRLTFSATAAAVLTLLVVVVSAQTKIATVEDYAKVMKANGQIGGAMNQALVVEPSYKEARKVVARARENFVALEGFWADRKRPDAVSVVQSGLLQLAAMDKLLEMEADLISVQAASEEFGRSTCAACHKLYREGSRETGFRFKPGVF